MCLSPKWSNLPACKAKLCASYRSGTVCPQTILPHAPHELILCEQGHVHALAAPQCSTNLRSSSPPLELYQGGSRTVRDPGCGKSPDQGARGAPRHALVPAPESTPHPDGPGPAARACG